MKKKTDTEEYVITRDGDTWRATGPGFKDIEESPVGFGDTPDEALEALEQSIDDAENERRQFVRYWKCSSCNYVFGRRTQADHAPCPKCKMADRFTEEIFDVERRCRTRRVGKDNIKRQEIGK